MRTRTVSRSLVILALALSLASACGASIKSKAVKSAQAAHLSVSQAQDAEIQLFSAGTIPNYSSADHVAFHAALVKYWDAEAKVLTVLRAWRAGDPPPADLSSALAALSEATNVAKQVGPDSFKAVLASMESAFAALNNVIALTKGA